ncbi:MAG: cytochrome c biogenesis protein DipZ [Candidatus Levybacteria bacterium]|nr:cytochrome c biogenesis protein DipZ [Candidatus Levybacteria bacterium]MBP9815260.1 cytochrome c biogenesis protein DipZ [Candidatus Levybacteria bacterium]
MILLIAFAFLAGVITVLSPCILPILPIILTSSIGGINTGKSRPMGVVIGFILSFTFFTLFLSTIVRLSGIPAETLRFVSVIVIAGFGASLLVPKFQILVERLFSKLAALMPNSRGRTGFGGGLIIGFSVGLLWTPCVGPILASVISLAITGAVTFDAFLITLAYSLGTAIPMFLIMLGGQNALRRVPWLLSNLVHIQKIFGVIMILTAVGIFFNADRRFQTFVINTFPQYGTGLTKLEDNELIRNQLDKQSGTEMNKDDMGKPMFDLIEPKGVKAPEIIPGGVWFNSDPLTLTELKGKVVVIDFWTYSCINCQRTLPYLREWNKKYKDKGLVIIGVHAPEFEFEKSEKNVAQAIKDFQLTYPVVQDNDFATWRAYNNRYWPAKYFIDKDGYVRYSHFGEGAYDESEKVIQELLKEAGATDVSSKINNPIYQVQAKTPELYLGYGRIEHFASPETIRKDTLGTYTAPQKLGNNEFAYSGSWNVMSEYANPQKGATLTLNFDSKEVFLVMRTKGAPAKVKVYLDDKMQDFGEHNINGVVTVYNDQLYKLINLATPGRHILRLEFEDNNAEVFAFTFG